MRTMLKGDGRYVIRCGQAKVPGEVLDTSGVGNDDFDAGLKQSKFGCASLHLLFSHTSLPR